MTFRATIEVRKIYDFDIEGDDIKLVDIAANRVQSTLIEKDGTLRGVETLVVEIERVSNG